uniref:Secreted protein n=1 Tax=Streptomyces sp. NBC_00003 TaxID=2903608 RepID=A0AAU2VF82_9ACTN
MPSTPPLQSGQRRTRRAWIAGGAGVLILVVLAVAAQWWLTRDDDSSPLAGRPRVTDAAAGLSYAVPEGWKRNDDKDLIKAFTSSIATKGPDDHGGAVVLAGRGRPVEESVLQHRTEAAARSNAEFFYPDGRSTVEESRATTVSGRPAYTVVLSVRDDTGRAGRMRLTIVVQSSDQSGFLLGITQSPEPTDSREVDAVLASARVR